MHLDIFLGGNLDIISPFFVIVIEFILQQIV